MLTSRQTTQTSSLSKMLTCPASEKAVIGNILSGVFPSTVISILPDGGCFEDSSLGKIYNKAVELKQRELLVDIATISDSLHGEISFGALTQILNDIYNENPLLEVRHTEKAVEDHSKMVRESWVKRSIYRNLHEGSSMDDVMAIYRDLQEKKGRLFSSKDLTTYLFDMLSKRVTETNLMQFPFSILQKSIMGLRPGQMIVVAARPSVGKSAFLENVAFDLAEKTHKVLFASAEMDAESLGLRTLSRISGIDLFRLRDPDLLSGILSERYNAAFEKYNSVPMSIYDLGAMPLPQLDNLLEKEKFEAVFLDYLSLVEPGKKYRSTYEKVTFASQEVKRMAVKHKIPFIVASQYNRVAANIQPKMSDLRDSGAVEQDADIIISLWTQNQEVNGRTKVFIDLLKNRNGWTFANNPGREYFLWFEKMRTQFHDVVQLKDVVD